MNNTSDILLAFYGDDLTGSTDALEVISMAGAKAVLFLSTPTNEQLRSYEGLQAYGIAGFTRSLSPEKMEAVLLPAFEAMKASQAQFVHYKVCSTFDSSPRVGSIGKAIDCGATVFQNKLIPVLGGTPALGRYCVFGNLFARMGTAASGEVYRLDRHPSMSQHPVTPANESDLRVHIGSQTSKKIGLIDMTRMKEHPITWKQSVHEDVVLLDTMSETQYLKIGEWMAMQHQNKDSCFVVGSSVVESALGTCWNTAGILKRIEQWPVLNKAEPLLVLSGSCSPVTKSQIAFAVANGFIEVPLTSTKASGETGEETFIGCDMEEVLRCLLNKKSVIIHTGNLQNIEQATSAEVLGKALGRIGRVICEQIKLKRVVVAGGDTSSYAGRAMGVEALEMLTPFLRGAPICKAHAPGSPLDGMEVNFKGGQVGDKDYFVLVRDGSAE